MLGVRFCARAFSSCGKWGPLFIAVHGPLTIAASLVAEHRLQTRRLSSCGSRAQLLRGMWDPPRPGLEPVPLHWQADSQPLCHQGSPVTSLFKKISLGNSLVVQWLGLCAFTAMGLGSIPGRGMKILQAAWHSQKIKNNNEK